MNRIGYLTKAVVPTVLFAAILVAGNAWAQARKTSISCTSDASGDVTGDLCVVSAGTYTADCACENGGGNCPSANNKQSFSNPVGAGQSFASTNGQIVGSETLTAPGESSCSGLTCPGGQTTILAQLITPQPVSVEVFGPGTFTQSGGSCTPDDNATPVRSGSCTTKAQAIVFNRACAALF